MKSVQRFYLEKVVNLEREHLLAHLLRTKKIEKNQIIWYL